MVDKEIEQWSKWNQQGLIPGPTESKDEYRDRALFCLNLKKYLKENLKNDLPFNIESEEDNEILKDVFPLTQQLYDITPNWVPIFFSNYQLTPWQGGCAWIFELNEQTPTAAFLQLRSQFKLHTHFLGIYDRNELLAHELAHVGRMLYQEPQFEEILAYESSSSKWRSWLAPIFQSSKETLFFIITLGFVILTDLLLLSIGSKETSFLFWIKLIPIIVIVLGLIRLTFRHHSYNLCLSHLETLYGLQKGKHLLYRLTDKEIKLFSKYTPQKIDEYIKQISKNNFRWNFLNKIYF